MAKAILSAVGAMIAAPLGPVGSAIGGVVGRKQGQNIREGRAAAANAETARANEEARVITEIKDNKANEKARAEGARARDVARSQQRSALSRSGGRSGTILTSPLGTQPDETKGTKTLLGS